MAVVLRPLSECTLAAPVLVDSFDCGLKDLNAELKQVEPRSPGKLGHSATNSSESSLGAAWRAIFASARLGQTSAFMAKSCFKRRSSLGAAWRAILAEWPSRFGVRRGRLGLITVLLWRQVLLEDVL